MEGIVERERENKKSDELSIIESSLDYLFEKLTSKDAYLYLDWIPEELQLMGS